MDPSNILFWNVCGLNGAAPQDVVRNLVVASKIDVVCLQETKMEDISRITLIQMLGRASVTFASLLRSTLVGGSLLPGAIEWTVARISNLTITML
jgi:hypothetical protein